MRQFILSILLFFTMPALFSQALLYPIDLEEKVAASHVIVEGKIMKSQAQKNDEGTIYTHHLVKVYRSFKGVSPATLEVITLGGRVGNEMLRVNPSLNLRPGDKGILFLQKNENVRPLTKPGVYEAYASQQGFIRKSEQGYARDVMKEYGMYESEFVPQLKRMTGQEPNVLNGETQMSNSTHGGQLAPSIQSFSPDTLTAGTSSQLTINGVGFGSFTGQAAVEFRNADDGGVTFVAADSVQIISWSNNQIVVEVPSGAGTGTFRVIDQNGSSSLSSNALHIEYNLTNLTTQSGIFRTALADINLGGGVSFVYNTNFASNTDATKAFERALQEWRCGTFVNFEVVNVQLSSSCPSNDGISLIAFDAQCQLSAGVLGRTYSHYTVCPQLPPQLVDVDIIFDQDPSTGWHFGSGNPTNFENDFESIALHELGHAHQIGHVINSSAVMHFNLPAGTARKSLTPVDIAAGNDVMSLSTTEDGCNESAMQPLDTNNCLFLEPTAKFLINPRSGCVPAKISFTDASTANPTSWQWDFQNDGTIDDTTQNPTFTYTTPGIYSVKLIVANANGADTLVRVNAVQIYKTPSASAGSDTTICGGEEIRLGGQPTGSGGTGFLEYTWSPEDPLNDAGFANPIAKPMDTTTFTVEVRDNNGCTAIDYVVVNVRPQPVLAIGEDRQACSGDTVNVSVGAVNPEGTSYKWNYHGIIFEPDSPSTQLIASESGEVELSASSPLGCKNRASFKLNVDMSPIVEAGDATKICGNTGTKLGGNPTAEGGAGGYTYLWQPFEGLDNSGAANPLATPSSTTTYTLTVFDAIGCTSKDTVTVEVLPGPSADAGAPPTTKCAGEPVHLGGNPTGSGGSGTLSYTWFPTATIDNISIANPTARPEENTTYSVIVVDSNGCRAEDSVEVSVLPTPTANAGESATFCGSGTVTLGGNPAGSGGVAPLQYQWAPTLGFPGNEPNPEVGLSSSTSFTLTVTGANGCADEDSVVIEVLAELEVDAGSADTICYGECATLGGSPVAQGGSGDFSYEWTANGTTIDSVANPEVCPASTTTYQVEVTDAVGCVASSEVAVQIKPFQEIEFTSLDTAYCENDETEDLSATPVGGSFSGNGVTGDNFDPGEAGEGTHHIYYEYTTGNGCDIRDSFETTVLPNPSKPSILKSNDTLFTGQSFASYEWLIDGSPIPNTDRHFYEPSASGSYQVRVFNEEGCSNISDAEEVMVGIEEQLEEVAVFIYPNPNTGSFVLDVNSDKSAAYHITIYDAAGKVQYTDQLHVETGSQEQVVKVGHLASGLYLLQLHNNNGQLTKRLIIE